MALILTLREGEPFFVGKHEFAVKVIRSHTEVDMQDVRSGVVHNLSTERSVEVAPDVFMAVGLRGQLQICRVVVDAPRDMLILKRSRLKPGQTLGN